jgi:hypothetical protein
LNPTFDFDEPSSRDGIQHPAACILDRNSTYVEY